MIRRVTLSDASFADPPRKFEAGTPPIAGAVGLGAAVEWAEAQDWTAITGHEMSLTGLLLEGLSAFADLRVVGPSGLRQRRGVVSFHVPGLDARELCRLLDERGVALRSGHHCAQPLMDAFGLKGTVRASLAPYSDQTDVHALLNGLTDAIGRLK
jgi:cysteine desulfurase/selenocysteine lyase